MAFEQAKQDLHRASRRAMVSIALNCALATGKGVAGTISGSTALLREAGVDIEDG